jgi:hypothetical protein
MGYYPGKRENQCPRCGGTVWTLFISVGRMSYTRSATAAARLTSPKMRSGRLGRMSTANLRLRDESRLARSRTRRLMPREPYKCQHPRVEANGHWVWRTWRTVSGAERTGKRWKCLACERARYVPRPRQPRPRVVRAPGYHAERCARYRATERGRERTIAANKAYNARNPDKRRRWVHTYLERIGVRVPDLQSLRRAINNLEAVLAYATGRARVRKSGELGSGDGAAGRDRDRAGSGVREPGEDGGAGRVD